MVVPGRPDVLVVRRGPGSALGSGSGNSRRSTGRRPGPGGPIGGRGPRGPGRGGLAALTGVRVSRSGPVAKTFRFGVTTPQGDARRSASGDLARRRARPPDPGWSGRRLGAGRGPGTPDDPGRGFATDRRLAGRGGAGDREPGRARTRGRGIWPAPRVVLTLSILPSRGDPPVPSRAVLTSSLVGLRGGQTYLRMSQLADGEDGLTMIPSGTIGDAQPTTRSPRRDRTGGDAPSGSPGFDRLDRGGEAGSGPARSPLSPRFDPMLSARPGSPVSEGRKD